MTFLEQYTAYQREVLGREVMATPDGWLTYQVVPDRGIYIADIYVVPEQRKSGIGRDMLRVIEAKARSLGLKFVYGSVDCTTNTWEKSVAAQEACGFKPIIQNGSYLILAKELTGGCGCEGM